MVGGKRQGGYHEREHKANEGRIGDEQRAIRQFLKVRTSYDVLPVSFRLIILDTSLLVNKSLNILVQNGKYRRNTFVTRLKTIDGEL